MNGHPQFEEDFDLLAVGVLEGAERQALEEHVRACPECAWKLEAARARMAMIALAAPPRTPPKEIRERLMLQVRLGQVRELVTAPSPLPRWAVPALAVAAIIFAVVAGVLELQNRDLGRRVAALEAALEQREVETARARALLEVLTAPETQRVTLVTGEPKPQPQGQAFYHARKGLLFYATHLPSLPLEKTYQLWLVPTEGNPISAGIFAVDPAGSGEVLLPPLPSGIAAKAFAVTVEPAGGVPQPTGPKVLVGVVS